MSDIAVCMACHNRRERTLACLASLFAAERPAGATLSIYLLDDGSTDGTGDAVRAAYPEVRVIEGDGERYWAGGMRMAYGAALEGPHDWFLWLNDDVELLPDALTKLFAAYDAARAESGREAIIVGAMKDPASGAVSYSGLMVASRLRPWKLKRRQPDPTRPTPCDTVNGNLVLIPRALALKLGNIDPGFTHAFGDLDYGFRARRAGARLWVAPGFAGLCAANANVSLPRWKRPGLSLAQRMKMINSPLGVPIKDQVLYAMRHHLLISPVVIAAPYATLVKSHFWPERS